MQLKEGMSVFTRSGEEVGKINRFVLDPATNEVTHIVIQKGWLLPEDKVVSFQVIDSASEDKIVWNEDIQFDELPPFEETYFVRADDDPNVPRSTGEQFYPYAPAYYWYPARPGIADPAMGPGFYPIPITGGETRRNIPDDTVALKEGTDVLSSDGEHVGDVERLVVEPDSNTATHFVISQGLVFKDRKLVPAHWVKSVAEDEVRLAVSTRVLERLPSYES